MGWAARVLWAALLLAVAWCFGWVVLIAAGCLTIVEARLAWTWTCRPWLTCRRARETHIAEQLAFYHLRPRVHGDPAPRPELDGRALCARITEDLDRRRPFAHGYRGSVVLSGLPAPREREKQRPAPTADRGGLVVVHVHYGLELRGPLATIGMRHVSVTDAVLRYASLDLPYTVVSFRMPTDNLRLLNLAQGDDLAALDAVAVRLLAHFPPDARFLLSGECMSALRIERWMQAGRRWADFKPRCAGLVLMTPISSVQHLVDLAANNWLRDAARTVLRWPALALPHVPAWSLLPLICPNVSAREPPEARCPPDVPALVVFATIAPEDPHSSSADVASLRRRFPHGTVLRIPEGTRDERGDLVAHGQCSRWPAFRSTLLAWIRRECGSSANRECASAPKAPTEAPTCHLASDRPRC
jgi:hypothetical protein